MPALMIFIINWVFDGNTSVIDLLVNRHPLPGGLNDHPLKGEFKGYRDLHIESDWLLIYKVDDKDLWLSRTGSHADLFGN